MHMKIDSTIYPHIRKTAIFFLGHLIQEAHLTTSTILKKTFDQNSLLAILYQIQCKKKTKTKIDAHGKILIPLCKLSLLEKQVTTLIFFKRI